MKTERIADIVQLKNERNEREIANRAEHIIDAIVKEQQFIVAARERIAEHRKELKSLEVTYLNPNEILGPSE